ncbi:MAG TPA: peptide chain release factor N(5)-glutamine methyltransferase [Burkholderiales bacterium]|nr:peptide chain release factor N(5)-glutamine methyltransferase [Burkholderiales bacterium]
MSLSLVTFAVALDEAARALALTSPTPWLDAEALLMHACDVGRTALIARAPDMLAAAQYEKYRAMLERRRAGEPIAYITGVREFWSLSLMVSSAVLIPRPETELLVERALAFIPLDRNCNVADLGTGSGAIALAIARERPRAVVVATDVSAEALRIARENAQNLGIGNVEFQASDWFTALADRSFDVIVSNPPYVRADDPHLDRGDLRYEPRAALVGGSDGLDAIRRIADGARARLRVAGQLLLEHGYDQADAVAAVLQKAGFRDYACHNDLGGRPRVTEAR